MLLDGCEDKVFACEQDVQNAISKTARENANAIFISKKLLMAVPIQVVTSSWESLAEDRETQLQKIAISLSKKSKQLNLPYTWKHVLKLIIVHRSM